MAAERVYSDSSKVAFDMSATHAGEEENAPLDPLAVLNLLKKVAGIVDTVNETQQKMQQQQEEIEKAVNMIQIDVARLHQAHLATDTSVAKLLEKTRKINVNMKDVRQRLDRTNAEVKKVEGNHNELLKRNKFRVIIFQEENEIASSVAYKKLPKGSSAVVEEAHTATEHMPPPDLSSDEEYVFEENTTSARLKKTGKKQVDNIKKAFSRENMQKTRQNIGKQMNRLSTTIVPPERREKIRISGERIKKSITDSKPFQIKKKNERSGAEGQEVAVRGIGESSKGEGVVCTEVVTSITAPRGAEVSQDHPQASITNVANTETVVVTMESKNEEVVPVTAEVKQNPEYS